MRKTIITLVVSVAILVPGIVLADGMPPGTDQTPAKAADPSKVTMSDLAADAPNDYTVVKGDTLWGIAGTFPERSLEMAADLGNEPRPDQESALDLPRERDPPGQVGGESPPLAWAVRAAAVTPGPPVAPRPRPRPTSSTSTRGIRIEPLERAVPSIPGSAIGPFLYAAHGRREAGGLDNSPKILATEESRVIVGEGDTMYADRIGSADGVNWQVFRPGTAVVDPDTGEVLGLRSEVPGRRPREPLRQSDDADDHQGPRRDRPGDRLMPARETSFPSYMPRAPDKPIKGVIMSVDGGVVRAGPVPDRHNQSRRARRHRSGTRAGELPPRRDREPERHYACERPRVGLPDAELARRASPAAQRSALPTMPRGATINRRARSSRDNHVQLPDERNGLVFVFRVFEKMSYAMVMKATKPLYVGDVVQTP